ncbi:MAG: sigma 54-interacting transcriptional regulator, partial [Verrucomicrobia bacterium]|nr:sigma 54-interacting transcriptional regulator [Verrucomicrobiota bacterium]
VRRRIAVFDDSAKRRKRECVVLDDFEEADIERVRYAILFDVFHRYHLQFDELIRRQIEKGQVPVKVWFAEGALADLRRRGFAREESLLILSLFYQMRRAYFFIEKSLIGQSESMIRLRMDLWNNVFTHDIRNYEEFFWDSMEDFSILLLGPTGSGKGAAAAAVGRSGYIQFDEQRSVFARSFTETFIPVNLSQFAETLLESELFGHAKGAFTGAVSSHKGLLELCGRHGTIFLDEIGDVDERIQIKLLKVLEERQFASMGSHDRKQFDGRVIAATHHNLDELRGKGRFRDDFYYRLCSDCINVPGLRERIRENPRELDELIAHTIQRITGSENARLCATVRNVIDRRLGDDYPWPGNVRELAQCIRRIIIKRDYAGDERKTSDFKSRILEDIGMGRLKADRVLAAYCLILYRELGTYEAVASRLELDWRTVKKHVAYGMQVFEPTSDNS